MMLLRDLSLSFPLAWYLTKSKYVEQVVCRSFDKAHVICLTDLYFVFVWLINLFLLPVS